MNIITIAPQTDQCWQRLVEQYPSSVFHSPCWMRVLATTYGFHIRAHVLLNGAGEPTAGIPFCQIEDIRPKRIVTLPFCDYCDPLVGECEQWQSLVTRLLENRLPFAIRCLHNELPLADNRLELVNKAMWHGLDLQPDIDRLRQGLHRSAKNKINKAQRNEVVVRIADREEELRAFFELHLRIRKYKYRLVAQPYRFFENIWHHIIKEQRGILMVAVYQDTIIGGAVFLKWKDTLYYKFSATAPDYLRYGPNDLIIWEAIKYGKSKGYTQLDFGASDWDHESLVQYKRRFANLEKTISFLRYTPNGAPTRQSDEVGHLLAQLTDLFTNEIVSDHVTEKAGEVLYRFFT